MKQLLSHLLFRFTTGLIVLGFLLAGGIAFDLAARGRHRHPIRPEWRLPGADPDRGRQAILDHGCGACHEIPGVRGATGRVGPKLDDIRHQIYLGGVLTNSPQHLADWVRNPRQFNPQTAMPDLDVTERESRDIAAFLFTR